MSKLNLSKSQYISGISCNRRLWLQKVAKMETDTSDAAQARMDGGNVIGELAQKLYPKGILIKEEYFKIKETEDKTKKAIQDGAKTIFEALAINPDGNYARIDILHKVNSDQWDMIEVKSSTGVVDYHKEDVAFQRYIFESAGYKIRKSILMHINNQYVKNGEIDLKQFFMQSDLTEVATSKVDEVKSNIKALNKMLSCTKNEPKRLLTPKQCHSPYECGYDYYCWKDVPEYSLLNLLSSRSRGKKAEQRDSLFKSGIYTVKQLSKDFELSDKEKIDLQSYNDKKTIISDVTSIKEYLDSLEYPIYYFDYETINPAIPIYDGTRPYQVIPFQFSLHIQQKDGTVIHKEFLHEEATDPREPLIKYLIKNIGTKGTILAHNCSYEKTMNSELAKHFPKYEKELKAINERIIDSKTPFSNRWIYNYQTCGSASLKRILPVFCPKLSYDNLEIQEGGTASEEYLRAISPETNAKERKKIFKNLKEYCGLDTMALVRLLEVLYKEVYET